MTPARLPLSNQRLHGGDDVGPDADLVGRAALPGERLVEAAVGGLATGGGLEEGHDGQPGVLDAQRLVGVDAICWVASASTSAASSCLSLKFR